MRNRLIASLSGAALLALLSGCATGSPSSAESAEPERVEVTLADFSVTSSRSDFEAGQPYEFVITNDGALDHEFRILPPAEEMGGMEMHGDEMHEEALLVVEQEQLPPGATVTVEYTFPADAAGASLEMACHTPGHYEAGMKMPITIAD